MYYIQEIMKMDDFFVINKIRPLYQSDIQLDIAVLAESEGLILLSRHLSLTYYCGK